MKLNSYLAAILASLLLVLSCKKESSDFGPPIGGILMTDINGQLIGSTDIDDDWQIGKEFSNTIENLFDGIDEDICGLDSDAVNVIAYPNPSPGEIFIAAHSDTLIEARHYRIINSDFELVSTLNDVASQDILIDLQMLGDPGVYRIFFVIEFESGCIEQGFGDVQLKE